MKNDLQKKVEEAKRSIRLAADMSKRYYHKPLICTYSGGKDSDVMLDIAINILRPDEIEVLNSHTSVDAPQTVYHIREKFDELRKIGISCTEYYPRDKDGKQITMWSLIPQRRMPPTRIMRYCCSVLKEASTPNRIVITGVREDESAGRKRRDIFSLRGKTKKDAKFWSLWHAEHVFNDSEREREKFNMDDNQESPFDCTMISAMKQKKEMIVNPIYKFTEQDIWQYIRQKNLKVNPLYFPPYSMNRVGCVGCPQAAYRIQQKEFSLFPKYKQMYIRAFDRMIEARKAAGLKSEWQTGQEVFDWWIQKYRHEVKGQYSFDFEEEQELEDNEMNT